MKRLAFVILVSVTLLVPLFSGATRGSSLEPSLVVRAGPGRFDFIQTQSSTTTRVSVTSNGTQANGPAYTYRQFISADGRYVAFYSDASNLVSGDTNEVSDIFVHDRQTGETTRVSVASTGVQGNGLSYKQSISADGRYVAFTSEASNLVSGDSNGVSDIFVYDRQTGQTTRVSVASNGKQGNGLSEAPAISNDGRYVSFKSEASNLVSGDTNGVGDIFLHNRQTDETTRISVSSNGTPGNGECFGSAISPNGRYIAFRSLASNLVSGDTNGKSDIFVHDRQTGQTSRVSVATNNAQGNEHSTKPSISADGRYVTFKSVATNLVSDDTNGVADIFAHDRQTGQTTRVSITSNGTQMIGLSDDPAISADGRYVTYCSEANSSMGGDTDCTGDIFVHDRQTGQTTRISVASDGTPGNGNSSKPYISADGRYVSFYSEASNLVSGDTNGVSDVFVHDYLPASPPPTSEPPIDETFLFLPLVIKS